MWVKMIIVCVFVCVAFTVCALCIVQCTLCCVRCALCIGYSVMCNVHCALYIMHSAMCIPSAQFCQTPIRNAYSCFQTKVLWVRRRNTKSAWALSPEACRCRESIHISYIISYINIIIYHISYINIIIYHISDINIICHISYIIYHIISPSPSTPPPARLGLLKYCPNWLYFIKNNLNN